MSIPTYHQILAEQYEENASRLLVLPNLHAEDQVEPHDKNTHEELENQDDFNKEIGSHAGASTAPLPTKQPLLTKQSIEYDRQIVTRVINVDSRFRQNPLDSTTNFIYKLLHPVKNVISVRVSSIEFPNVFFSFSKNRGNTSFELIYPSMTYPDSALPTGFTSRFSGVIQIPDGNYDISSDPSKDLIQVLIGQLNTQLAAFFSSGPTVTFTGSLNIVTGQITIASGSGSAPSVMFDINFGSGNFSSRVEDFGLGYNLGFRKKVYLNQYSYTSESIINTTDTNYIFMTLDPDWKVIIHDTPDRTQHFSFAKIIMDQPKNAIVYDNGQNTLTKEYFLRQPTDIITIRVRISDPYDQDIDLIGTDFSFSLEVKEVVNASLYESMRS